MKLATNIAGGLLGLLFVMSSLVILLKLGLAQPQPPADSAAGMFMGALVPTGYMTFVKVLELIGGLLVAIPRTRNFGLLVLGPIIVNILAFHIFITQGASLKETAPLVTTALVAVLAAFLLWSGRKAFAGLANSAPL